MPYIREEARSLQEAILTSSATPLEKSYLIQLLAVAIDQIDPPNQLGENGMLDMLEEAPQQF
jgi:hypothetical protein